MMNGPSIFNKDKPIQPEVVGQSKFSSAAINLTKIFAYMFFAVLGTGVFSVLFAWLFAMAFTSNNEALVYVIYAGAIVASIGTFVCAILAGAFHFSKSGSVKSRAVAIPFALYSIFIAYLFGFIVLAVPMEVLAISFGVTALVFGVLALIGLLSKGNMNVLLWISMGLFFGISCMIGLNFLMMWIFPEISVMLLWVITFAIFAAIMFSTIWDVWNIKQIAQYYENTPNVTLYCAFRLYCDFIALFLRILYFVMIIFINNRN